MPPLSVSSNGHIPHDYHIHSNLSCDSQATMAEMCRKALALGISEIAFTEHFDPKPEDVCAGFYNPAAYFHALELARLEFGPEGLTIRAGIEVGEMHRYRDQIEPVLARWPYDLVLGSLHWVGENSVFDPEFFCHTAAQQAIADYFTEQVELVRGGGFDVLSHLDVFKRTAYRVYGEFDIADWEDLVRPVWQACIETGIGIEINTSGWRYEVNQPHPPLEALRWYRDMGGELLTVGSDSHQPAQLGFSLPEALNLARAAGFTRLACYERRRVTRWFDL